MAAVTQQIPSYLGGVSRQADKEKLPGFVRDVRNTYPDVTFGMTKRPGFTYVRTFGGNNDYKTAYFFLFRHKDESYICVIRGKEIEVYDAATGTKQTVEGQAVDYLDGDRNDFRTLPRQDYILILNKKIETKWSESLAPGTITGEVNTIAELPILTAEDAGELWKVTGVSGAADDYVLYWTGATWEESIEPGAQYELAGETMPHMLERVEEVDPDDDTKTIIKFVLKQPSWKEKKCGVITPGVRVSDPSWIGNTITEMFFHKNRLGFLSGDAVFLGQPLDFFNVFPLSYMTATDADPVDIIASSLLPTYLFAVEPVTQGLLLFSDREQFILQAGQNGVITPSTASIQNLSEFEVNSVIHPVRLSTNVLFTSLAPSYTRVFSMSTRGDGDNPDFEDIGKVVSEWIPSGLDRMTSNTQNDLIALNGPESNEVFFYRTYTVDGRTMNKSWFKWECPGNVLELFIINDVIFGIINTAESCELLQAFINPTAATATVETDDGLVVVNPCVDLLANPNEFTVSDGKTTVTFPYKDIQQEEWKPILIQVDGFESNSTGSFWELTYNKDDQNYTFDQELSDIDKADVRVGYTYPYEIELPKTYFRNQTSSDFTASLTISRMKFAMGKTGAVGFEVRPRGSTTFAGVGEVGQSNWYRLDTAPIDDERFFTLPIHQKNDNFDVRIASDSPYPVSLLSMSWEGQYSPRYYSRT